MKRLYLCLLLTLPLSLFARSSWTVPQDINTLNIYNTGTSISLSYLPDGQEMFAFWQTQHMSPCYATFTNGSWSTPHFIPSVGSHIVSNPQSALIPTRNELVIAWRDFSTNLPYYMIYTNGTFSDPQAIPGSQPAYSEIALCYYPDNDEILATWSDQSSLKVYFSTYNGQWSTPAIGPSNSLAFFNIHTTYSRAQKAVIASWTDIHLETRPSFALYNGSWGERMEISHYRFARGDTTCCYNEQDGTTLCAWVDVITYQPMYTVIDHNGWSVADYIPNANPANLTLPITLAYTPASQEVVALWVEMNSQSLYYTTYQNGNWNVPGSVSAGSTALVTLSAAYYPPTNQLLATWGENVTGAPLFSLYTNLAPLPPTNLAGVQKINNFGMTSERYNQITWGKSPSQNTAGYILTRNGTQIAVVSSETTSHTDHNRTTAKDSYSLTSVSPHDRMSLPITIVVGGS